jgi:hypothetical protein
LYESQRQSDFLLRSFFLGKNAFSFAARRQVSWRLRTYVHAGICERASGQTGGSHIVAKLANWNAAFTLQLLLFLLHHPIKKALNFVYKPLRE